MAEPVLSRARSRRNLLTLIAGGLAAATTAVAVAAAKNASLPMEHPSEISPAYREAANLVRDFERHGVFPMIDVPTGALILLNGGGLGHEPADLWYRFRACDREALVAWVALTHRFATHPPPRRRFGDAV